jgi:hypothetical protein
MVTQNWAPVRRGKIYCAPACGGDCTFTAYQQAQRRAKALAKKLGMGWTIRVWENLGWYYEVVSPDKVLTIHPTHYAAGSSSYFLSFDIPGVRQLAATSGPDLQDCLDQLSNTLFQSKKQFEFGVAAMKKFIRKA